MTDRKAAARAAHLMRSYGLTRDDYQVMLTTQASGCAICGRVPTPRAKRLAVDHDHQIGPVPAAVRGLLCWHHNRGLALFQDQPQLLEIAAAYLRAAEEK